MEKIKAFIEAGSGDGSGFGGDFGSGYGSGSGYADGSGDGDGYAGYGSGSGDGLGSGGSSGDGFGGSSGGGFSYGAGYGYGIGAAAVAEGYGNGFGDGIKSYAGKNVYLLDGVQTIIAAVHRNTAVGYILGDDLALRRCYIAKGNGYFAHGYTLKGAVDALQEKIFEALDTDEKIGRFITEVDADKKYPAKFFYDWHHRLTGSCEMGRKDFAERHGIDLDTDSFTVREFINLTENAYGGEIIRKVKERLYENNA